jgi:hypothetical protein
MSNEDLFARNAELERRMEEAPIEDRVHALLASGKRNRHLIRLTIAGLLLDLVLSLVIGYQWHRVDSTAESVHSACVSRNKSRAEQVKLWNFVIDLSSKNQVGKTPAEMRTQAYQVAEFQKFIGKTFAPIPCD